jgi:transcriptional regulator with XRE-family HTH domain
MQHETFPAWLHRRLQRKEWTQSTLAKKVGVSTGRVSEWTTGTARPNPRSCDRIADALGADLREVMQRAGHLPPDPEPNPLAADLCAKVRKIDWSLPGRFGPMEGLLDQHLEFDRQRKGAKAKNGVEAGV